MTDRPCPVERCGAALASGQEICRGCTNRARLDLREVPALLVELDLALSRQTRMAAGDGMTRCARQDCPHEVDEPGCVAGVTLDLDTRASEARLALVLCLHGWARVWDEETPPTTVTFTGRPYSPERDRALSSTAGQAGLLYAVPDLGSRPWAADLAREVRDAVEEGWRAVDRPPDTTVVGRCPECGRTLYGAEGAVTVRCRNCGTTCNRVEVREASIAESRILVTAAQMGTALGIDPARVRQWRARGLLTVRRYDLAGRPLYRVADGQALALRGVDDESA